MVETCEFRESQVSFCHQTEHSQQDAKKRQDTTKCEEIIFYILRILWT